MKSKLILAAFICTFALSCGGNLPAERPQLKQLSSTYFSSGLESGTLSGPYSTTQFSTTDSDISINSNPLYVHSGHYSAQIHFYICGDSTNPACRAAHQDDDHSLNIWEDSSNPLDLYADGLSHFLFQGYVYIKHPEAGATVDGIQRKLVYMWADTSSPGNLWSCMLTTDATNGVMPVRFVVQNYPLGGQTSSYYTTAALRYNTWYSVEIEVQDSTVTAPPWDGLVRVWVNGELVLEKTQMDLNRGQTYPIKVWHIGQQVDRGNYDPVNEYRFWDDITLSAPTSSQ